MPIDFHDKQNRSTYASRNADESWLAMMQENVQVAGKQVADIGCGGGIYTKALVSLGAAHVTAADSSAEILAGAKENCQGLDNITFVHADAYNTGLPGNRFDLILERALIHHLSDLKRAFQEVHRLLRTDGIFVIQDRTPQDSLLPSSAGNLRGYFLEQYPQLVTTEIARRYDSTQVREALEARGFVVVKEERLWEVRRVYNDLDSLGEELLQRTGRSILHELTDEELSALVSTIRDKLAQGPLPIIERDAWTVWFAQKK
jgi:ubiquinone/menaquinone biosynthesis C-methylase UbiE